MSTVAAFQGGVVWLALKGFAVWLVILGLVFANAALRELVLIPQWGKSQGLMLSGVVLAALALVVAWVCLPWLGTRRAASISASPCAVPPSASNSRSTGSRRGSVGGPGWRGMAFMASRTLRQPSLPMVITAKRNQIGRCSGVDPRQRRCSLGG